MKNNRQFSPEEIFYRGNPSSWHINENCVMALKELIPSYYEGGYVDQGVEYRKTDNEHIIEKYRGSTDSENFMIQCHIAAQFMVRTMRLKDFPQELVQNFAIKDYHISLINRLYYDGIQYDDYSIMNTADKRPFGNSYMIGDVYEELQRLGYEEPDDSGESLSKEQEDKLYKIYEEVIEISKMLLKEFPMYFREFQFCDYKSRDKLSTFQVEYYEHNWSPDISEFRDKQIEKILT